MGISVLFSESDHLTLLLSRCHYTQTDQNTFLRRRQIKWHPKRNRKACAYRLPKVVKRAKSPNQFVRLANSLQVIKAIVRFYRVFALLKINQQILCLLSGLIYVNSFSRGSSWDQRTASGMQRHQKGKRYRFPHFLQTFNTETQNSCVCMDDISSI